jgi:hypothetical protein
MERIRIARRSPGQYGSAPLACLSPNYFASEWCRLLPFFISC